MNLPAARRLLGVFLASLCLVTVAEAQNWTRFRGPNGSGVVDSRGLPVEFGPGKNMAWKAVVPFGRSSPVLGDGVVFLSGSDEEGLITVCLDSASGEVLWQQKKERARILEVFKANDSASPTPVTDGDNVYVFFPELGLVSYDKAGEERWVHPLGPFQSFYGMSGSPILAGEFVVLLADQKSGSFLLAVNKNSGETVWRTEREGIIECWTTPLLYPSEDRPEEVITFGSFVTVAYSVKSGEELWRQGKFGYTPVCSPVLEGDRLYAVCPYHAEQPLPDWAGFSQGFDKNGDALVTEEEMGDSEFAEHFGWMDLDDNGSVEEKEWESISAGMNSKDYGMVALDLTEDEENREVWRYKKGLPSIATPLLLDGVLYLLKDSGILTALDAETGEELKRGRLTGAEGMFYPSPVAADNKIYMASNEGKVAVLEPGEDWSVRHINDLGEPIEATPAIGNGTLFIRTSQHLYCFATTSPE